MNADKRAESLSRGTAINLDPRNALENGSSLVAWRSSIDSLGTVLMVHREVRLENYALANAKFEAYRAGHLRPEPLVAGANLIGMGYEPGAAIFADSGGAGRRAIGRPHREPGGGDGDGAEEVSAGGIFRRQEHW